MIEAMIDLLFPYGLIIVWIIFILLPEREDEDHDSAKKLERAISEMEEAASEYVCLNALKGLSGSEFERLPNELKPMVPDRCRFCRWILCCDPLEMAISSDLYCSGFKERV